MGEKLFSVSYDDGTEQDRRIIALMERYGIRGTFNLSSGLFGKKTYIRLTEGRGRSAAVFIQISFAAIVRNSPASS